MVLRRWRCKERVARLKAPPARHSLSWQSLGEYSESSDWMPVASLGQEPVT